VGADVNCPQCRAQNAADAVFCDNCGSRLEVACANCGGTNRLGAKFCNKCGQRLPESQTATLTAAQKFGSVQAYTPKHLAEKILSSKHSLEGERKQVTVLFADMKGSMELVADRDPEEARKILDPILEQMMEAVHRYEGTVNQVMGDGIMALFGAPLAHEDHAVRACYAALRMQESVKKYAEGVRRTEGIPIQIRMGLNSGEVVVRSIGSDLKIDYTAVGQTTHLAARMEQMAMPGSILMTTETLALTEGFVQVKPLGPVNVKGLTEPVEVYEITGAGPVRSRLQAGAARGLTRFVGRTAEFETLCQALERAGASHGQMVALVGEPGVGKSRLFWEFTHSRRTVDWLILESSSVSYGKATAYLPVINLLRAYFSIEDRDDVRKIREKVIGKLLTLDHSLEPTLPAFLTLLDATVEDQQWKNLDPPQRHQRTLEAIKRLLLRESQVQPLLLVIEDLHWVDSETQALLDSLVESLPTARLLLLVNYRPEYQHGWGSKTYYSQLRIDPLPPASAEELLQTILGNDPNLRPLKQLLIERTEGNPFFIEESVRTLVETKVLVGEQGNYRLAKPIESTQVPATVQAVLAARIDRLPADEKGLLQSAAVIGKDVPLVILQAITDQSGPEISRGLSQLQAMEFLYETSLFPEVEYTFKHALTHEVAYGSILQARRRSVHSRIVAVLEQLYSDRLGEQVERLAHHALRAELWEKAVDYLHQAGKKAAARSATREAVATFEQALDATRHLPENRQAIEKAISIRLDLGPLLIAAMGYAAPEVEQNYSCARELCEQLDATPQLFPVLWALARIHDVRGELNRGRDVGEQLLQIAERVRDSGLLLEAHHERWANLTILGELTSAWTHLDQGFSLYDPQNHREHAFLYGGHDPGVCCGFHASHVLWLLGYPDHALRRSREAVALARELALPSTLHLALSFTAWFYHRLADRNAVRALVEECITLVNQQGFTRGRARTTFLQGWLLVKQRQQEAGIEQMSTVLAGERERQGSVAWVTQYAAVLAEAYRKAGQHLEGLTVISDALAMVHQSGGRYCEAELHRIRGELLRTQAVAHEEKAESCFIQAIDVARSQSAKSWELRATMSLSSLWQKQGKKDDARKLLGDIYGWFTEGLQTADLKAAKSLLNELT
jgi:predicted ATPase/class 3 adenylate cyclase